MEIQYQCEYNNVNFEISHLQEPDEWIFVT